MGLNQLYLEKTLILKHSSITLSRQWALSVTPLSTNLDFNAINVINKRCQRFNLHLLYNLSPSEIRFKAVAHVLDSIGCSFYTPTPPVDGLLFINMHALASIMNEYVCRTNVVWWPGSGQYNPKTQSWTLRMTKTTGVIPASLQQVRS